MVRQHLVAILLSFVLVKVLVLNCFEIKPDEELMENKSFEDGPWYNPNSTDRGPVSSDVFDIHPNLAFLGSYNNKFWFIERTLANYKEAIANCTSMGMIPAKANQAELNFLSNVTASSDDHAWLGGYVPMVLNSFVWMNDSTHPESTRLVVTDTLALTMCRYIHPTNSNLHPYLETTKHYYYCVNL